MPGLPAGAVTVLFTGIEGSTARLGRLDNACYAELLADCRGWLGDACTRGRRAGAVLRYFPAARAATG